jgi:O-antigen ligase
MTNKNFSGASPLTVWLLGGTALTTLAFYTSASDPFNTVKFWVLLIVGSWLLGNLCMTTWRDARASRTSNVEKLSGLLVGVFLLALLIDLITTDVKFNGLFGAYQRRTGLLAYLGFAVLFMAAMKFTKLESAKTLQLVIFATAFLMTIYGFLQHFHHDFVKWNNPYNPILTTLGNPDFSSAVLGIFVVSAFGLFMNLEISRFSRFASAGLGILMLLLIKFSGVTQGFLAAAVGCGFILLTWVYQKSKTWGRITLGAGLLGGFLVLLGTLQIGPLTKFIFKPSVTYRGDYWRAGFRMLKAHPIFGVGLDRYGAYFGQYRDATQVLRRGPNVVSNAAHNVWIQLAATGGLLLLLSYLALMVFVGWRAVVALRSHSGNKQIVVATVVGLWLTYQAQAFISIDNIGIAVWGWLFGGMIVAISISEVPMPVSSVTPVQNKGPRVSGGKGNKSGKDYFAGNLISAILVIATLVLVSLLARGEVGMHKIALLGVPKTQQEYLDFQKQVDAQLSHHPVDPQSVTVVSAALVQTAQNLATAGDVSNSLPIFIRADQLLVKLIAEDPRNVTALRIRASETDSLAQIYASQKDSAKSMAARKFSIDSLKKMCELDPYNSTDWLQLGKAYKAAGDMASAKSVIAKIAAFDPKGADLASAKKEFGA